MNELIGSIFEFNSNLEIEDKAFNILTFVGGIISLILAPISYFIELDLKTVVIYLVFGLTYLGLYLVGKFKRNYRFLAIILIIFTLFLTDPYLWFTSGGSNGIVPFFFLFDSLALGLLLFRSKYRLLLGIHLLVIFSLYIFEYNYPEQITGYIDKKSQLIDQSVSLIMLCGLFFFVAKKVIELFHKKGEQFKEMNDKLRKAGELDSLTKLFNRASILKKLSSILDYVNKKSNLSVIQINIDNFKQINNNFGFSTGDKVLEQVAKIVQKTIKIESEIGRVNGDEFLIILPNCTLPEAEEIAEKLCESVELNKWAYKDLKTSIRIGLYSGSGIISFNKILSTLDNCLSLAKNNGGNCIKISNH